MTTRVLEKVVINLVESNPKGYDIIQEEVSVNNIKTKEILAHVNTKFQGLEAVIKIKRAIKETVGIHVINND